MISFTIHGFYFSNNAWISIRESDMIKTWLREIRANFLILAVVLVMIGGAAAWHDGVFRPFLFILTLIGIVIAHISVNLFNEYSDWRTGIDSHTKRTPFSGGSGNMQAGRLDPGHVRLASWLTLAVAFCIGLCLAYASGWPVIAFMIAGGVVTVFYTDYLAKWLVGEVASGIALGSLVVIGTYFVQTESITPGIVWASIPPGLLTMALLYLNEFPDMEADRAGGRYHLVIALGRKRAAVGYVLILAAVYAILITSVVSNAAPRTLLLGLLTIPVALMAAVRALRYSDDMERLVPALGMNVMVVLATDFLMVVGFLLG